ncbi:DNA repair protein Rad4p [Cryptosporidium canis]|uniref:DNA repair protein Rad4p n=1 Tax=Cryptosporidium canis TaxID=195482 RepID=A0A9D5DJH9_9CRYT|nr:DNA repair protein Rad4p [Cryptosporidium canis]
MNSAKTDIRQTFILGWLIHLRLLNRVANNVYIQSCILSLYLYYNHDPDIDKSVLGIFRWFRKYFRTYYLPNDYWIYKLHSFDSRLNTSSKSSWLSVYCSLQSDEVKESIPDSINGKNQSERVESDIIEKLQEINGLFTSSVNKYSFFMGTVIKRSLDSILSGRCSAEASNILFATLIRALGFHSRLTLFIPPVFKYKKKCEFKSNDRRAELWVEIFEPRLNKWISVDIHRGGWNFTGCALTNSITSTPVDHSVRRKLKDDKGAFSKLFLNDFNDNSDSNDEIYDKITKPISIIPLKKNAENQDRIIKYGISSVIEQDEQRESLAFEFSKEKKTEALSLSLLKCKIDISSTNIKYKMNDNIGWWIISVNEDGFLKETTSRYVLDWSKVSQTQLKNSNKRMIDSVISRLNSTNKCCSRLVQLDLLDDFELEKIINDNDLIPVSKMSFKNHPKYAIISSLNSLEIIHPKEPIVGYFHGEPIYLRRNVHRLKTRAQWEQEQREIKKNQQPIKIIYKRNENGRERDKVRQEYFAEFQTQIKQLVEFDCLDKIPKGHFKSINISTKCSIPDSCIHIKELTEDTNGNKCLYASRYISTWKMENTFEIIKRSGLDYARAFIGFDYNNGAKPKYDGQIINKEDFTSLQFFKKRYDVHLELIPSKTYLETVSPCQCPQITMKELLI